MTMGTNDKTSASQAEELMKRRRFAEAIALFNEQLAEKPNDLKTKLRLGICHLLNRDEQTFLAIYQRATDVV